MLRWRHVATGITSTDAVAQQSETPVVPLLRGKSSMGPKHYARVAVDRVAK